MNWIKKFFNRTPKTTGRIINIWEHFGWGNSMYFLDWQKRKVSGHLYDSPSKGDILRAEMNSGKIAEFVFTEVEYCKDPRDMFFGTVKDIGYFEVQSN